MKWTHEFNNDDNPRELIVISRVEDRNGCFPILVNMNGEKLYSLATTSQIRPIRPTMSKDAAKQLELYAQYRLDKYGDNEVKTDMVEYLNAHRIV